MHYPGPKQNNPKNHSDHLLVAAYQKEHGVLPGGDAIDSGLGNQDRRSLEDRAVVTEAMYARLGDTALEIIALDFRKLETPQDRAAAREFLGGSIDLGAYAPRAYLNDGFGDVPLDGIGQPAW